MMDIIVCICTAISVMGALCVSHNKPVTANYLWSVSNIGFIVNTILIEEYCMTVTFVIFEAIALYGIYKNRCKNDNKRSVCTK